ncbi:NAD(P)H-binding protein [Streptomyces syringium]|uniref:NAD(P)H-binding protein n=1 Tax=Streptomyces syringium TaxID=76729 RepID=UPI00342ACCF1
MGRSPTAPPAGEPYAGGSQTSQTTARGTVRVLTRTTGEATGLPGDVEVVGGDLTKPQTLAAAFDGASAVHLLGATGHDHAALRTGPQIMAMVAEAGV